MDSIRASSWPARSISSSNFGFKSRSLMGSDVFAGNGALAASADAGQLR
jgi:hypothetical protein